MPYTYDYWRPQAAADAVILRVSPEGTDLLLVQRAHDPYAGAWAFPGGFIDADDEDLAAAAARELAEETGLVGVSLVQVGAWGSKGRDPRDWTLTVVFGTVLPCDDPRLTGVRAGDDAANVRWFPLRALPTLAFDHASVIPCALPTLLKGKHGICTATP